MSTVIRAKFRCLAITTTYDKTTVVKLGPVKRDGKDEENSFFWKYTPSGEAELTFPKGWKGPFTAGDYYYLDMTPDEKGGWRIQQIDQQDYNVNIAFSAGQDGQDPDTGMRWGSIKLGLSGEAAGARAALQPHGSKWNIQFKLAEISDV